MFPLYGTILQNVYNVLANTFGELIKRSGGVDSSFSWWGERTTKSCRGMRLEIIDNGCKL